MKPVEAKSKLVTVLEYAAHRGIAASSVYHAVKSGRIGSAVSEKKNKRGGVLLDLAAADSSWNEGLNVTDSMRNLGRLKGEPMRRSAPTDPDDVEVDDLPTATESNARKLHWQAKIEKQKYQKLAGESVDRDMASRQVFEFARGIRDALLGVPNRIDAELASESNQIECRKIVRDEILAALTRLDLGVKLS